MAATVGPENLALTPDAPQGSQAAAGKFDNVLSRLRHDPWSFDFFQAVWLLERMRGSRQPVGFFSHPSQEMVRFGVHPSIAFPASEIQEIRWDVDPPQIVVNFMGLTGPTGVLPHVYTVLLRERAAARDYTLRDFLDLFHHRWISLFYRGWKKYRFPVRYGDSGLNDRLTSYLFALVGMATPHLRGRQSYEDGALIYYAGLVGLDPRSGMALEQMLADYFKVPVAVEQFVGAWYSLPAEATCRFEELEDPCEQLGLGAVVGDEVWDMQSRVRIRLGPLTLRQYDMFLPGRSGYGRLRSITRFYARDQMDFEVQLVLLRQEVPHCVVGGSEPPVQLGWTTWVKTRPQFPRDPEDAVFLLQ